MKMLAFDTSAAACSIALSCDGQLTAIHQVAPIQQASLILPMIKQILDEANLALSELDMLAYGCGPGSFTGIRIASAVAQGLSFAYSLPIMPVSSLAAIAQAGLVECGEGPFFVAVDARMGDVYWAVYVDQLSSGYVELIDKEQLSKPESVLVSSSCYNVASACGLGDAWEQYKPMLVRALGFEPAKINSQQQPTAAAILTLAQKKLDQGATCVTAAQAVPVYLR